jgi:hypothetical protein
LIFIKQKKLVESKWDKLIIEKKVLLDSIGEEISTRLLFPENALCLYVFAHGAGAGIDHEFILNIQKSLFKREVATFTFNFVYKERGKKLPSSKKAVDNEYKAIWDYISNEFGKKLNLFAGGKSMGGRVSTRVVNDLVGVKGLIFLGFPIHSPGKPEKLVADYIKEINVPMLFLQGSNDPFSQKEESEKLIPQLQNAELHWLVGGNHSWETSKKASKNQYELIEEACNHIVEFCKKNLR